MPGWLLGEAGSGCGEAEQRRPKAGKLGAGDGRRRLGGNEATVAIRGKGGARPGRATAAARCGDKGGSGAAVLWRHSGKEKLLGVARKGQPRGSSLRPR